MSRLPELLVLLVTTLPACHSLASDPARSVAPSASAGSPSSLSPKEASTAVAAVLGSAATRGPLTPAFPASWPPSERAVQYFLYPSAPLPTGRVAYEIGAPTHAVTVTLEDGKAAVKDLPPGAVLGEQSRRDGPGRDALAAAERVLFDVVNGKTTPEAARKSLEPYAAWLASHDVIAHDLHKRTPAFIDWLRAGASH